eukprot:1027495-Prorocentrum_minimum.AAC.1
MRRGCAQGAVRFAELLWRVAEVDPEMRIRFTSPHPKDFPDELLQVIRDQPNVCNQVQTQTEPPPQTPPHFSRVGVHSGRGGTPA